MRAEGRPTTHCELLERGRTVAGRCRGDDTDIDPPDLEATTGDVTDRPMRRHPQFAAMRSRRRSRDGTTLTSMAQASVLIDGSRRTSLFSCSGSAVPVVSRPSTRNGSTPTNSRMRSPLSQLHRRRSRLRSDDLEQSLLAPATVVRTSVSGRIRTEPPRPLVADENGETVISLLDDAIAFVHEPTIGDIIYG